MQTTDTKKLGMTELIALHNRLADNLGVAQETSFKSLGAARAAISNLESKMEQATNPAAEQVEATAEAPQATAEASTGDRAKYNSSGKRGPNQGVGAFAKEQIIAGKSNAEVLAMVKEKFPDAKTTTGCIAFYRTALAKGPAGKSPEQLRAEAAALIAKAEAAEAIAAAQTPPVPEPSPVEEPAPM